LIVKIITSKNKVRKSIVISSFKEAKEKIKLFAKRNDTCYVQVASSMKMPGVRPNRYKAKISDEIIVRAENGRVLSRREIQNMQKPSIHRKVLDSMELVA